VGINFFTGFLCIRGGGLPLRTIEGIPAPYITCRIQLKLNNKMATIDVADVCNTISQDLANVVGANYGATQRQKTGFLDAVISPDNTAAVPEPIQVDAGDGKIKQVIIRYLQAGLESEVVSAAPDICLAGTPDAFQFETVVPELYSGVKITFTNAEMRKWCGSPAEDRSRIVLTKMNALFVHMNKALIAKANAGVGGFYGGVAAGKQVQMLFTPTGGILQSDPAGEVTVLEDMSDLGIAGAPLVVGAGNLSQYVRYAGIGCCNDYGQDISGTGAFNFYRDQFLGGVTGNANDFLAFAPGAVQLAGWNANKGEFAVNDGASMETTVIDPVTGIELDLDVTYDKCDKVWVFTFSKTYDLFITPSAVFQEDDPREGVNNLFKYRALAGTPA